MSTNFNPWDACKIFTSVPYYSLISGMFGQLNYITMFLVLWLGDWTGLNKRITNNEHWIANNEAPEQTFGQKKFKQVFKA